jgi:parvulin-like peptidyl-prolyl isomerase
MATGKWAPKVYRAGTRFVVLRVRQKLPAHPADFDEARAQAIEAAKNEKRRLALDQKAESIRKALAAGVSIDSLAAPYGGMRDAGSVVRTSSFLPYLGPEPRVVEKAFAAKPGQLTDTLHVAQGVVWLRIEEKKGGDPASYAAVSPTIEAEMVKKRYDTWVEEKKRTVKIEVLRPDLKGPRPVAALNP